MMARNRTNRSKARKIFLYTLGAGVAAGGAYLAWDYLRKRKGRQQPGDTDTIIINNQLPAVSPGSAGSSNNSFPLKQGSRGTNVALLQQALDNILGVGTMKKSYGGIDGIFGPLTAAALKKAGYGEVVDEATFKRMTGGGTSISFNPKEIASALYSSARSATLSNVLAELRKINSTADYSNVNEYYKRIPIVARTIVTDLLDYAFTNNEPTKQQLRGEFLRMGLKVDSSGRWSLQGLPFHRDIITLRPTYVIDSLANRIPVRAHTILGDPVKAANGMTWFRAVDNNMLQVPTQDVARVKTGG